MTLFGVILLLACTPTALLDFAVPKWKTDKAMRIDDAYKYLYQATRGGEHAAPSRDAAKKWLDNEWQDLGPALTSEPVWEPLCPGGEIGRLNLRPFKDAGRKADELLDAFLASAHEYRSEPALFTDVWFELGRRLKRKPTGVLDHKKWKEFDRRMKEKDYPAVHHSAEYNKAKRPAYRILTLTQAKRLMPY